MNVSILGNSKLCERARASVPRDQLWRRGKSPACAVATLSRQLNCRMVWWAGVLSVQIFSCVFPKVLLVFRMLVYSVRATAVCRL